MKNTKEHVTHGNVFEDLGFPPEEAAIFARKIELMLELEQIMKRRRLTVALAAKRFGVDKAAIAHLKRNNLDFFSVDLLIQMLECAGKKVAVVVSCKKRDK